MLARMLPNYFCYESVGLVCFNFFTRALFLTGLYYSYLRILCNTRTVCDNLYIWLCSQQKDKRNLLEHTSRRIAQGNHWITPRFDPCTPEYKYQ